MSHPWMTRVAVDTAFWERVVWPAWNATAARGGRRHYTPKVRLPWALAALQGAILGRLLIKRGSGWVFWPYDNRRGRM